LSIFALCVVLPLRYPLCFFCPLVPFGGDSIHFDKRRSKTIVILAEYAAPKTRRSVSLEKTQIPMLSLK